MTKTEERVLNYVNRLRKQRKIGRPLKRLPKGSCGAPHSCVLGVAFRRGVYRDLVASAFKGRSVYYVDFGIQAEDRVHLPGYVSDFVGRFDRGAYKHLIAKS